MPVSQQLDASSPQELCSFGCQGPIAHSFQKLCIFFPTQPCYSPDYYSQKLSCFFLQLSQNLWIVTVDPDCPSSSPGDSCVVFISSAWSLHVASQPCFLFHSPTYEMIMYHGGLGGFWILCHLLMSGYKYRYTNKHDAMTNGMNEGSRCKRTVSSIDK